MTAAHVRQFVQITIHRPMSNIYSDIIAEWSLKIHDCLRDSVHDTVKPGLCFMASLILARVFEFCLKLPVGGGMCLNR